MPRTAITLAKTHAGKWEILSHPETPISEQLKNFKLMQSTPAHKEFSTVVYQESDASARVRRFSTPADHKSILQQRAAETAENKKYLESPDKKAAAAAKAKAAEKAKRHAENEAKEKARIDADKNSGSENAHETETETKPTE